MKIKKLILTSLIFVILTGVFNMLCFVFNNSRNENFIISLVFGNFSIIAYAITALLLFKSNKYKYLSLQNIFIVCGYYLLCTVMNLLFILFNLNNSTVNWVINVLLLAAYTVFILLITLSNTVSVANLEHDRIERVKFNNIKIKSEELLNTGHSMAVNKKIEYLYDKIRSAQINGSTSTADIDGEIYDSLIEISSLINSGADLVAIDKINKTCELVNERNNRIKNLLKK